MNLVLLIVYKYYVSIEYNKTIEILTARRYNNTSVRNCLTANYKVDTYQTVLNCKLTPAFHQMISVSRISRFYVIKDGIQTIILYGHVILSGSDLIFLRTKFNVPKLLDKLLNLGLVIIFNNNLHINCNKFYNDLNKLFDDNYDNKFNADYKKIIKSSINCSVYDNKVNKLASFDDLLHN